MEALKLPHIRKSCIFSNLYSYIQHRRNPTIKVSRNKITNIFFSTCLMEHTSISSNSAHTDLILSTFLSVKETIMLIKPNQNPRKSILWVGCKTYFTAWTVKPKESKTWQVAITALWQSCSVSPCKRVSSMNANTVWPKHLRHDRAGLRSLVRYVGNLETLAAEPEVHTFPHENKPKEFW